MIKMIGNPGRPKRIRGCGHPVKLTALLYLKEALLREKYEACQGFIALAEEFGAVAYEIQDLLEDPRRSPS